MYCKECLTAWHLKLEDTFTISSARQVKVDKDNNTNRLPNPGQKTRPSNSQQKKKRKKKKDLAD